MIDIFQVQSAGCPTFTINSAANDVAVSAGASDPILQEGNGFQKWQPGDVPVLQAIGAFLPYDFTLSTALLEAQFQWKAVAGGALTPLTKVIIPVANVEQLLNLVLLGPSVQSFLLMDLTLNSPRISMMNLANATPALTGSMKMIGWARITHTSQIQS